MKTPAPWLAAVVLLIGSGSAFAQIKDAVELLPAETLACLEVRQPSRLAREIAVLVKGSSLEDLPRRLAQHRGENNAEPGYRYYRQQEMLGMLSMFLSPEMLDEIGRTRGGFVALTGFAKDGTPEVVGFFKSSSNFPALYMRAFLSFARPRLVGEIEGVPLYREVYAIARANPGLPRQSEWKESGPVMAELPGTILFGSTADSLKSVIRRVRGKSSAASLTHLRAFKNAAALRERPGLFAYVDVAALQAKLDELASRGENAKPLAWIAASKLLLGDQTIRTLTFSLTLQNGSLESQAHFTLNDKSNSPLLGLLPDRPAPRELLHFAPQDALLALTGGLGDSEKRWKTFLDLLDAIYALEGQPGDNRPSRSIQEMEKKLGLQINKDVLAEVTGAGIVVHKDWRRKLRQLTLLLRAVDEKAAVRLEKNGLPRLCSDSGGEPQKPREEEVGGRKIKILAEKGKGGLPLPICYGREGAILVIGFDRECVVESLNAGSKKEGLLAEPKVAAAVKEVNEKAAVGGVLSSARAAMDLIALMSRPPVMAKRPAAPGAAPAAPVERPPEPALESTKSGQALLKAAEPLVFTLHRQADSLELTIPPTSLRRTVPRLLDVWIAALLQSLGESSAAEFGGKSDVIAPKK